jgi:dienelactone hydrolase
MCEGLPKREPFVVAAGIPEQMRRGLVLCLVALCAGCGGSSSSHPSISASPRDGLIDARPRITVVGGGDGAVVRATTVDRTGQRWTSTTAVADVRKDPTRPLWSMSGGQDFFVPPRSGFSVRLDLVDGGRSVAHTSIRRRLVAPGVRGQAVRDGLFGELYEPPGAGRRAAALVIGGSEGGLRSAGVAGLLASHGYPALALAYFEEPGLPSTLKDIPLEYFARALERLRAQPDVDPRRVVVIGVSRGGEGALLIGSTYPKLVQGVVGLVPSDLVYPALDGRSAAWTLHGRPVAHVPRQDLGNPDPLNDRQAVIHAERVAGPILTASGGSDTLWPSADFMTALHERLDARHFGHPHRDLDFGQAGHLLGSAIPYLPAGAAPRYGGTPRADAAARAALWPRMLQFMRGLRGD